MATPRTASPAARPLDAAKPAAAAPPASPRLPPAKSLDDALLNELAMSLEEPSAAPDKDKKPASKRTDSSLDEQMNKLLGEISKKK
jgi:hypothetical protein